MKNLIKNNVSLIGISLIFILLNGCFLFQNIYYFALLPLALAIVYFSFYKTKELLFFVILTTPFSLNLEQLSIGGIGFYLPTEPILFGLVIILSLRLLLRGNYDRKILKHPITLAVIFYLAWLFITMLTSSKIIISLKFIVATLWFVIPLFFYMISLFKKKKNMYTVLWLYLGSLALVVLITLIRHYSWGFDEKSAHWIMSPFYKDHTSYGALVAFYIPITIGLLLKKNNSALIQYVLLLILSILFVGLIYSYTRAAWLSLVVALGVLFLFRFQIKFKYIAFLVLIMGLVGYQNYTNISIALNKNKTDAKGNLSDHLESISNVSTDASNLERINRWNCAVRMFKERPIFGWGPGAYSFTYAPFQHSAELTVISTNFGTKGNAHSEYLGKLSETGFIGLLSFLLILFYTFYRASILYLKLKDKDLKILLMSVILSLVTYFVHGVLNNYLDTDKASVPVWTSIAIIVAIDIYYSREKEESLEETI